MNESERDLLIRIDERTESTHRWVLEHQQTHKDERATRWKIIAPIYAALIAVVSKAIFWD